MSQERQIVLVAGIVVRRRQCVHRRHRWGPLVVFNSWSFPSALSHVPGHHVCASVLQICCWFTVMVGSIPPTGPCKTKQAVLHSMRTALRCASDNCRAPGFRWLRRHFLSCWMCLATASQIVINSSDALAVAWALMTASTSCGDAAIASSATAVKVMARVAVWHVGHCVCPA